MRVHKVAAVCNSLITLRLDMAAISKDSSHNEQPNLLSNGPLLAEQRPTKGLPFL